MIEMIEGRNIDEDIRNAQAVKSTGIAGWLKMALFGYALVNYLDHIFTTSHQNPFFTTKQFESRNIRILTVSDRA
ncbi:hypothetical protein BY996DRAFT_6461006 [Phakopsora pachyrhizi]|nr:hypothetical protein BY996DRAFT_6461006 [Phakopsora pachyrhizi]